MRSMCRVRWVRLPFPWAPGETKVSARRFDNPPSVCSSGLGHIGQGRIVYTGRIVLGKRRLRRRGIMIIILCLEYQSVCPFVRIGSPRAPSTASECVPPEPKGGGNTRWRVMGLGRGEPIRTTGEKAWHSVYSVVKGMECPRTFVGRHIVLASIRPMRGRHWDRESWQYQSNQLLKIFRNNG